MHVAQLRGAEFYNDAGAECFPKPKSHSERAFLALYDVSTYFGFSGSEEYLHYLSDTDDPTKVIERLK